MVARCTVLLFISAFLQIGCLALVQVDPTIQQFVDENGNTLLFHGINAIYKLAPFYPPSDKLDPLYSLSKEDFEYMHKWGFNVIRLFVSWAGTEPTKGNYNFTYLEEVRKLVRASAAYNISIILDAHQDAINRHFCGEGSPDWAFTATDFPAPFKIKIDRDQDGYPLMDQCLTHSFNKYSLSKDVARSFQKIYTNENGLADSLIAFWSQVSKYFANEPNVIGYEIINEPQPGDFYQDPSLFFENGKTDRKYLQPLYEKVHAAIRANDDKKIIFFESMVENIGVGGFTKGPGGPQYNDRQVLSFHIYCSPSGDPKQRPSCDAFSKTFYTWRKLLRMRLGVAGFVTEFGAVTNSTEAIDNLYDMTDMADADLLSWTYWQYKYYWDITTAAVPREAEALFDKDGNYYPEKVKALARPYIYKLCGELKYSRLIRKFGVYEAKYRIHKQNCVGANGFAELYLNGDMYYKDGFEIVLDNCEDCVLEEIEAPNYYRIRHSNKVTLNSIVSIEIVPKLS
eukprot:TRINITY_DN2721_c0_g1_i3.p1 TRINITY_DN2721_c0_g1~~TRINITY_DN2721_c0_g1_i3.p1  ORF type:complete len:511 (+),score=85.82 TRINITY_DN2721_c0_g1_i3:24-1556(+)